MQIARFARNVEWGFFFDFQTLWSVPDIAILSIISKLMLLGQNESHPWDYWSTTTKIMTTMWNMYFSVIEKSRKFPSNTGFENSLKMSHFLRSAYFTICYNNNNKLHALIKINVIVTKCNEKHETFLLVFEHRASVSISIEKCDQHKKKGSRNIETWMISATELNQPWTLLIHFHWPLLRMF